MKLFPYTLVRTGGGHLEDFITEPDFIRVKEYFNQYRDFVKEGEEKKILICENLRTFMEGLTEPNVQKKLQNFRRDLYNNRTIKEKELSWTRNILNGQLNTDLTDYLNHLKRSEDFLQEYELLYYSEIENYRSRLKELAGSETLRKGLLLSSKVMFDQLGDYTGKTSQEYKKREYNLELSLLQYLSRIYTKTSPFSTFTNVSVMSLQGTGIKERDGVKSHIRMNNYLFRYLKNILLQKREFYYNFTIRLNSTIVCNGNHYKYLINHNNLESFQSLETSPVLEYIVAKLNTGVITFSRLLQEMLEETDATEEALEKFLYKLIESGFLEFDLNISGIDTEWDTRLSDLLMKINSPGNDLVNNVTKTLSEMRAICVAYETADSSRRMELLQEIFLLYQSIFSMIDPKGVLPENDPVIETSQKKENTLSEQNASMTFRMKPESMLYEDTKRDQIPLADNSAMRHIVSVADKLFNSIPLLSGIDTEKEKMKLFFLTQYRQDEKISTLDFYEQYYRSIKKPADNATTASSEEEIISPIKSKLELINQWAEAFIKSFLQQELSQEVVCFSLKNIHQANLATGEILSAPRQKKSRGMFVQLLSIPPGSKKPKAVLNTSFLGYGKMASRFLHLFPSEITNETRSWNQQLSGTDLLCEITDSSNFNANLHPLLMPYEIKIPGGHTQGPVENQLPVNELDITYCKETKELILLHCPSNKRVRVFDLGFQGAKGRSPLFLLLNKLAGDESFFLNPVVTAINAAVNTGDARIVIYPRIVFEEILVIQRRAWLISKQELPVRAPLESDFSYFVKIAQWKTVLKLPEEVFIKISQKYQVSTDSKNSSNKDNYKPQYIHFNNPLLIKLLEKMIHKVSEYLTIEEMLPSPDEMLNTGEKKIVTEHLLQWYE